MNAAAGHLPVLAKPVMDLLAPGLGHRVLDCTAGRGGHAELLARAVGPAGHVFLMDRDAANLAHATARVAATGTPVQGIHGSFAGCERAVAAAAGPGAQGVPRGGVDRVLADLGFASNQMDDPARGFSFQQDGPLDMRLDRSQGESAAELLARMAERDLADAIFRLGEDPFARRIARVAQIFIRRHLGVQIAGTKVDREFPGRRQHECVGGAARREARARDQVGPRPSRADASHRLPCRDARCRQSGLWGQWGSGIQSWSWAHSLHCGCSKTAPHCGKCLDGQAAGKEHL